MRSQNGDFPAFPGQWYDVNSIGETVVRESHLGMTKRELIATHLMAGAPGNKYEHAENAKWATEAADALLAGLSK